MPTRDIAWPAGTPCWVDYSAADLPAAQSFYADLLGWSYTDGDPEYGGYLTCLSSGQAAAGMVPRMEKSMPPSWTTYFATDDADKTAEAITALFGGEGLSLATLTGRGKVILQSMTVEALASALAKFARRGDGDNGATGLGAIGGLLGGRGG